jgi:hypothetical protein
MILGFTDKIKMSELKVERDDLRIENIRLKADNTAYRQRIEMEFASASFGIDWDAMKVFSIERNWSNGFPTTILGYMLSEPAVHTEGTVTYKDVVREWTLHCSAEKHEQLVSEFNEWKSKGKKK